MEEVNKLRNILELGRKFGESIANNPKDQACVELMSPETFEMLKKFGEALKNLED